jgi:hypothetical protein
MVPKDGVKATCDMWQTQFRYGFKAWTDKGNKLTPMKKLFSAMGSEVDPSDMVNCEAKLNGMKAKVSG